MHTLPKNLIALFKKSLKLPLKSPINTLLMMGLQTPVAVDALNTVEAVVIPDGKRTTLCVSSQAGCTLNCTFCATGKQGFNRNLTRAEIVGQLWLAKFKFNADVSNVVFMGMGEPLYNYDNVSSALALFVDDLAYGLSKYKVTVSTSGIVPVMDKLTVDHDIALAISLHSPNDGVRNEIVPINRKYNLDQLMQACQRYLKGGLNDM